MTDESLTDARAKTAARRRKHPMGSPIMQFFTYAHLPTNLQAVSKPIGDLARKVEEEIPDGPEKSAGLRKLLEAKDCFVRAELTREAK